MSLVSASVKEDGADDASGPAADEEEEEEETEEEVSEEVADEVADEVAGAAAATRESAVAVAEVELEDPSPAMPSLSWTLCLPREAATLNTTAIVCNALSLASAA